MLNNMNDKNPIEIERLNHISNELYNSAHSYLDLIAVHKATLPQHTITYLDFVLLDNTQQDSQDNVKEIGLKLYLDFIELKTHRVKTIISADDRKSFENRGINTSQQILNVLSTESIMSHQNLILSKIEELGEKSYEKTLKWYHKLFRFFNSKYKKTIKVKNSKKLINHLLFLSNKISIQGRRGSATFAIVSTSVGDLLLDSNLMTETTKETNSNAGELQKIGNIAGINIYVDYNRKFNDPRITVGRKTTPDGVGIHFTYNQSGIALHEIQDIGPSGGSHWGLLTSVGIKAVGQNPEVFYINEYLNIKIK